MSGREDDDSDAPEEVTALQGIQQDEEIRKALQLSKSRVRREGKERRKKLAARLTPRQKSKDEVPDGDVEMVEDDVEDDESKQSKVNTGMLPSDVVNLLAAREKQVFLSDSEDEKEEKKLKPKKKRAKFSGVETVILKELPPPHCVQNSLEFLKKRKMQVPRSNAVLNNSKQALRLLSSSGLLK
ncbi:hypothetical protein SOVF_020340 [Spinacia oleracea]|uniref:Ribosome biogenesis protein NOP53 n=1 Tax=Spinacia oleracea TaxID=3562 RepID=A0A9R0IFN0_SPIOL|nr:uncharacterized protein LOC110787488 [Spinacia oleracea]KNA23962.1 hypothetical protein SOVF_020340 [Spinacia oleracea]